MDNVNVLNQMAEYDFSAPIDVTMIFEDSDDDISFENVLSEREMMKDNSKNKEVPVDKCGSECLKHNGNQINYRGLNKSMLSLNKNNRINKKKHVCKEMNEKHADNFVNNCKDVEIRKNTTYDIGQYHSLNKSNGDQHALIVISDDTVNNEESSPNISQINDHEPVTMFIEDLLNKLSEHIVLIMQSFYYYSVRKSSQDKTKREKVFQFIKSHFFELSYTTVESIILPQEQNDSFMNQFLDNTVLIANSKPLQWKCQRRDVQPFLKELVAWTKQKRDYIKQSHLLQPSNDNIILKQQLIKPLQPFDHTHTVNITNSNTATQKTQNNLCIFSSGTPGSEISINIDADTFIHFTERQCITAERTGNHTNHASSTESTSRNKSFAGHPQESHVNIIQKNNTKYDRPPPPYNINHTSRNCTNRLQQYNQNNLYPNQNYNMGQPHQNHQSSAQTIQNYPTQVHYINTNQTSPSENGSLNPLLYDNLNKNTPTYGTQMENQITSSPVITNVTSFNPKTRILNVRCYMCGKSTSSPCGPYHPPCRPTYCSYLCQELDSQIYKSAVG